MNHKKAYLTLSFFICLTFTLPLFGHDSKISLFEITKKDKVLELSIRLDLEDLAKALSVSTIVEVCDYEAKIVRYIIDNFSIKINNQAIAINNFIQTTDKHYLDVSASLGQIETVIKQIVVSNTCLIKEIDGQTNIVHARVSEKTRSFRMNEDRTTISIIY